MKINLHHIFFSACLAAMAFTDVFGQDSTGQEIEATENERDKYEREKVLYSPGEGDSRYVPKTSPGPAINSKDSASSVVRPVFSAPVKPKTEQPVKPADKQHQPKDDDSILSFNFLHYIIQKYKLQDIID